MAFLPRTNFQRNRGFLLGEGEYDVSGDVRRPPEFDVSDDFRAAPTIGSGGAQEGAPGASPIGGALDVGGAAAPTAAPDPFDQPKAPEAAPEGAETPEVPELASFSRTGSLSERLFSPAEEAAATGGEALTGASELFGEQAGPSRTYESAGAQGTLASAYQQGQQADMDAARDLVGAQYTGPAGLDQGTVAGLGKLTGDLRTRQQALSTGGGLQTLIGGSVAGLTPGQALYEAKRQLPGARVQARDLGFETIAPLEQRLEEERQGALDFAEQRTGEEADIAARSRGYLEGERGGISEIVQQLVDERAAQQQGAVGAYGGVLDAGDNTARLEALQAAAPFLRSGTVEAPGELTGADVAGQFNTQATQDKAAADALFEEIMGRQEYAGISEYDPLELGITGRGRQFYDVEGEDVRKAVSDKATRQLLYDRQRALEADFDPARGDPRAFSRTPAGESAASQVKPLYGGEEFSPLDQTQYLGFDPGVRPSRDNSSSAVQKEQFNRINDLLGELDRIAEGGEMYRAAQIFADADSYLEDEATYLEQNKENLSASSKAWYGMVKKARKGYRKAKREKKYAKIGAVIGGVIGGVLGIAGGPVGVVGGASTGSQVGASAGRSLA